VPRNSCIFWGFNSTGRLSFQALCQKSWTCCAFRKGKEGYSWKSATILIRLRILCVCVVTDCAKRFDWLCQHSGRIYKMYARVTRRFFTAHTQNVWPRDYMPLLFEWQKALCLLTQCIEIVWLFLHSVPFLQQLKQPISCLWECQQVYKNHCNINSKNNGTWPYSGGHSLAKSVDEISKFGNLLTKFLISAKFL